MIPSNQMGVKCLNRVTSLLPLCFNLTTLASRPQDRPIRVCPRSSLPTRGRPMPDDAFGMFHGGLMWCIISPHRRQIRPRQRRLEGAMFTCQLLHRDARLRGVCRQVLQGSQGRWAGAGRCTAVRAFRRGSGEPTRWGRVGASCGRVRAVSKSPFSILHSPFIRL